MLKIKNNAEKDSVDFSIASILPKLTSMKNNYAYIANANPEYMEDLYKAYKKNADSVDVKWNAFFEGFDFFETVHQDDQSSFPVSNKEISVTKLIQAYRTRGHLLSNTNPVRSRRKHKADLELSYFGLTDGDLTDTFESGKELGLSDPTLANILNHLNETYCSSIGVEFMYCQNEKLREWMMQSMEPIANRPNYSKEKKIQILNLINKAVNFENFLQTKFVGKKRFSLEGIESLIPSLDAAIQMGGKLGVRECILGMAHRGRLNVLVNVFQKTYENVFSEFEETAYNDLNWSSDVKYHLGRSADITTNAGTPMHLSLIPNPSHLEAVNPVVTGIAYSKISHRYDNDSSRVLPILIHGDAAFSGQGVNYEVSNMSQLDGYTVGGTIHIVLNNQIGFTANYKECRSSVYCTDLAKVTESPVFHVNADDPVAVVHAVEMAVQIRDLFGIDVYVDILGYRKYGHNEGDEPRFTQPLLYDSIKKHDDVFSIFQQKLIDEDMIDKSHVATMAKEFKQTLQMKLDMTRKELPEMSLDYFKRNWEGFRLSSDADFETSIHTGVSIADINTVANQLVVVPDTFNLYKKTKKLLDARHAMIQSEKKVDWALAEQLAFGTLIIDGHDVRMSGQDCQRGTFSHRHAVIKDEQNEVLYTPVNELNNNAKLEIINSHLSEYCVMGFEYGYSMANPSALTIWEAQFGDFSNGAQIIIDQFLSSSEKKWQRMSGLVLLLPHGYEGQGPEHSSARLERYLQLCAENNMYVTNITEPANLFHALRRQVKNEFRIPLVNMSPKSLLRHPDVVSDVSQLVDGKFHEIIDDCRVPASSVKRVICCTGKVYYDLVEAAANNQKNKETAIVRFEQLYPLPKKQIAALKKRYSHVTDWRWVQEEPENMGAWVHILRHCKDIAWRYVGRSESASPAVGSSKVHAKQQGEILSNAFKK